MTAWQTLGAREPRSLEDARLQTHWAARAIASVGMTFATHKDDDSHTNMEWLDGTQTLTGQVTASSPPFRLGVDPGNLTLILLDLEAAEIGRLSLHGETLKQGYDWLAQMLATLIEEPHLPLDVPAYDLPEHSVGAGAAFSMDDSEAFAEVSRWFANAHLVLRLIRGETTGASPVRCWPHHFDIATLVTLDPNGPATIGVGMTAGDGYYTEPYWYVTPGPTPTTELSDLVIGAWHTHEWTGAVLTGTEVVAAGDATAQHAISEAFLGSAIETCKGLLAP